MNAIPSILSVVSTLIISHPRHSDACFMPCWRCMSMISAPKPAAGLDLVVDASASMQIPLLTDEQFAEWPASARSSR